MGFIHSELWFSTVFLTISEKKLITGLEKIKKYMFWPTCEYFNLRIYIILNNQNLTSVQKFRVETATYCHQVEKSIEDILKKIYGINSASEY